ncbi:ABC transporter substrate-binding protein [Actinokineospora sp.]|uniref:ABC transporter substrate-binding protein n=1 Tax=Actinokineospora sp. TaxID=1872133 RepID=UPI004037BCE1
MSRRRCALAVLVLSATAACTGDATPPASGDPDGKSLVIAAAEAPATLDPLAGYAPHGAAKIYDGLVEHQPGGTLRLALAATQPETAPDGKSWTVRLRGDVSFHDGTAFDAADVVAGYRPLLDPKAVLRPRFWMLSGVTQVDPTTVRFDLSQPYAGFAGLLVLGIRSSEAVGTDRPVGTGPYEVAEWVPRTRLVLTANRAYFADPPAITRVTVEFEPDDEARAQHLRDGRLDGTALPARLAAGFERADGFTVVRHSAADLRAVTLPGTSPVTADPAVRLALNLAVDRRALVEAALAGQGSPASLPVPDVLPEFVEPGGRFEFDVARARAVLDAAGWVSGADGVRTKAGVPATITVAYPMADQISRDLVTGLAGAAAALGIQVTARPGAGDGGPELVAFGDPFDPDPALYPLLHPAGGATAAALDAARATTDPAQRAVAIRAAQRAYLADPGLIVLSQSRHSYVIRENWNGYQPVVDAPGTDHTWGAWWNVQRWTPR